MKRRFEALLGKFSPVNRIEGGWHINSSEKSEKGCNMGDMEERMNRFMRYIEV